MKLKKRVRKKRLEDLPIPQEQIDYIAKTLAKQIDKELFEKKYAGAKEILKLVGAGAFLAASIVIPNLPLALKPFLTNSEEYESWKRFNIPYLKRTLMRLKKQKLVEIDEEEGIQVVKITEAGRRRILKYAIDELAIKKPKFWDGRWTLVSYDIPEEMSWQRDIFRDYLKAWGFFPLEKSVFLHAYPCQKEIEFLREYLGIGKYVNIFTVSRIEKDRAFRKYFGI